MFSIQVTLCTVMVLCSGCKVEEKDDEGAIQFCNVNFKNECSDSAQCQFSPKYSRMVCCYDYDMSELILKQQPSNKRFRQQEIYLDTIYKKPVSCNLYQSNENVCPVGYNCILVHYLGGTFCGKDVVRMTSKLVCPNFEYPYYVPNSLLPMPCDPGQENSCPLGYRCQLSAFYSRTICCKPYPGY